MVWHLHLIEALAAATPAGTVAVLAKHKSGAGSFFAGVRFVEDIIWLERNPGPHDGVGGVIRLAARLRGQRFGRVWVLHPSPRYAMAACWAGIPDRRGYGLGVQRAFLTDRRHLPRCASGWHPIEKGHALLALHEIALLHDEPVYPVSPAARERVLARFDASPRPWLGLGIGSAGMPKRWPLERYGALGDWFVERTGGTVFLLGAPWDEGLARAIIGSMNRGRDNVVAPLTDRLDELAAASACLDCFVGNDSAALNLAAAVQVPSLGLFGASRPLTHSRHIDGLVPPGGHLYERREGMVQISLEAVMSRMATLGWL